LQIATVPGRAEYAPVYAKIVDAVDVDWE
jgi:hypothetical protein